MTFGKSRIFLLFCLSFVVGVFFARYLSIFFTAVIAVIFIAAITVWWGQKKVLLVGLLGLTLLLGSVRYAQSFPDSSAPNFIGQWYGQEIVIEGVVVEDPDVRADRVNLTVRPITSPSPSLPTGEAGSRGGELVGNILLNAGRYPEYEYGDKLLISGELEEPFESEEFSYKNYLSRFGVYGLIRYPEIEKIASSQGNMFKAGLLAVKHKFQDVLSQVLPEPHNAFVLGLLLGLKKAIPESLNEAFILTGVSHIVVISGYNISIITRSLLKTRLVWGRRLAFWLSLATVLGFVVLTGAEASVIRAAIMGMLLIFAMNVERIYQAVNALIFAGAVMIALNPQILVFDIGFQLSFLATLGLIFLSPMFDKWFRKIPDILGFRTNLASTLAAQIFTLPLLIFYFDRISLLAPLVNVIILWTIPYTMLLGFLTGVLGILYLPLGMLLAGLPWIFLEYMIRVVEFFSRIPFVSASVSISLWALIGYYVLLALAIWWYRNRKRFYYQLEYIHAGF